ncbi:mandelate racemase/muconate lactonizing enzyme family protein [Halalkalibacter oceani]|uniref:mandelate racemase/muconate lactonizing enzyme family protein n=1 Tax=Halalkalibacter oceani TaxID=1653776 RepID=UPI003397A98D
MKIVHVEATTYRIPPAIPWEDATHVVTGLEYIIVKVITDNKLTGVGWSHTPGIGATAVEAIINDYLAKMLLGQDVRNIEAVWQFMNKQVHRCGSGGLHTFALAAVDIALWDILGKFYQQPLYRLLGGAREEIPAYGSGIDYSYSFAELYEMIDEYIENGYQTIKIKLGYDSIDENIERISRVKARLGKRQLLIDLNQKWTAAKAIHVCSQLDNFQLGWIEEPLSRDDVEGHAMFRRHVHTPLAVGENLFTKYQFNDYLKADAIDIVQADVGRVGGITEWIKIAHLADAYFRPVAPHFVMELSVSLLCAVPNGMILENIKGGSFTEMGVLQEPIVVKEGVGKPPQVPGHGVLFDFDKLEQYRVDSQMLRKLDLRSAKG